MSIKFDAGYCPRCEKKVLSLKQSIELTAHALHIMVIYFVTPFWAAVWITHIAIAWFSPWLCNQCGTKTLPYSSALEADAKTTPPSVQTEIAN